MVLSLYGTKFAKILSFFYKNKNNAYLLYLRYQYYYERVVYPDCFIKNPKKICPICRTNTFQLNDDSESSPLQRELLLFIEETK
jgi:hypothetical protein